MVIEWVKEIFHQEVGREGYYTKYSTFAYETMTNIYNTNRTKSLILPIRSRAAPVEEVRNTPGEGENWLNTIKFEQ
jgi:hypothetical protein